MDCITPVYEEAKKRIKIMPQHTLRASSLGDPCDRRHVYSLTRALEQLPHDVGLQRIFEEGELQEKAVIRELQAAGIQVHEQQRALEWKEYGITGHIDCVIYPEEIDCDIKSMSAHIFDSIFFRGPGVYEWSEVEEGFQKKHWLRKYRGQITIYMLMTGRGKGMLLCKNKGTGALAQVNVPLDYAYGEELLQRAERVNAHVKAGTIPDRIPWDPEVCPSCSFYHICLPDHVGKDPLMFLEDAQVVAMLDELSELEEDGKRYVKVKEQANDWAKARPEKRICIGNWLVEKKPYGKGVRVEIQCITEAPPAREPGQEG